MWSATYEKTRIAIYFKETLRGYYDLIPPPVCSLCSYPLSEEHECPRVIVHPNVHSKFLTKGYTMGLYYKYYGTDSYFLSKHINNLKHFANKAEPLGSAIAELIKNRDKELLNVDCIVSVPKLETEFIEDEYDGSQYNQADQLAQVVSNILDIPLVPALSKSREQSMGGLGAEEREEQNIDLYECQREYVSGEKVLLIDDVTTTGSTLGACAKAIMESGGKEVRSYVCGINYLS